VRVCLQRAALIAGLVLGLDELVKTTARVRLAPCIGTPVADCDRLELVGPLWLVRAVNAGSALGFRPGWWIWIVLAACGLVLIPIYARWLGGVGWVAAIGVGLQIGGASANLLDRVVLGGASDVLYVGGRVTWNLADVAIAAGALVATWALVRCLVPLTWGSGAVRRAEPAGRPRGR
jgi:lipoprotein signal peptidase